MKTTDKLQIPFPFSLRKQNVDPINDSEAKSSLKDCQEAKQKITTKIPKEFEKVGTCALSGGGSCASSYPPMCSFAYQFDIKLIISRIVYSIEKRFSGTTEGAARDQCKKWLDSEKNFSNAIFVNGDCNYNGNESYNGIDKFYYKSVVNFL